MIITFWQHILFPLSAMLLGFAVFGLLLPVGFFSDHIKRKIPPKWMIGFLAGIALAGAVEVYLLVIARNFYVVTRENQVEHFLALENQVYRSSSGKEVELTCSRSECLIYNNASDEMVVQPIVYSLNRDEAPSPDAVRVPANELSAVPTHKIRYLMSDHPPAEISLESHTPHEVRYWLHPLDEDMEWGEMSWFEKFFEEL